MYRYLSLSSVFFVLLFGMACAQSNPAKEATTVKYKDLNAAQFQEKMNEPNAVIIDVRTDEEFAQGNIAGAIKIDYRSRDFKTQIDALDKSKAYYVYCASGGRSAKACNMMERSGFKNVSNLLGGYSSWPYK